MSALLLLLLSAALIQVMVLAYVPAWRAFVGVSDVYEASLGISLATALALPVISGASYGLAHFVLVPSDLEYLRLLVFILLILTVAAMIQAGFARSARWRPARPAFLAMLASNCALLGVAALGELRAQHLLSVVTLGLGAGAGFALMLLTLAAIHERLRHAHVPTALREAPLALITVGIMALAFMGFSGLIQE